MDEIMGTPVETIMLARQCINELAKKHKNFDEEFKNIEYLDNGNISKDIERDIEKFNNLYGTLCVLRNVVTKVYGNYSHYFIRDGISNHRKNFIRIFERLGKNFYYSDITKKYLENVGFEDKDETPTDDEEEDDEVDNNQNQNNNQEKIKNVFFYKFQSEKYKNIRKVEFDDEESLRNFELTL